MTLQLDRVLERLAARHITLRISDDAATLLGDLGYDPVYGARPLKRVVAKQVVDRLATAMLDGSFNPETSVALSSVPEVLYSLIVPLFVEVPVLATNRFVPDTAMP